MVESEKEIVRADRITIYNLYSEGERSNANTAIATKFESETIDCS